MVRALTPLDAVVAAMEMEVMEDSVAEPVVIVMIIFSMKNLLVWLAVEGALVVEEAQEENHMGRIVVQAEARMEKDLVEAGLEEPQHFLQAQVTQEAMEHLVVFIFVLRLLQLNDNQKTK